ncbi:amidohydrolase [bacterium]|nr:amidohydrolase [bacterium]MBP9810032.1 amidohydrolase [bacterium]
MKEIPWIQIAKSLQSDIVHQRRYLHTIPELGFREEKTAAFVAKTLEQYGYCVRTQVGTTGVVADLGLKPVVAIRAEMDGLPMHESTTSQYRSLHDGISHSCGHDVNMACVLAAAKILTEQGTPSSGVRIIMQPAAEESVDAEGKTGTFRMIEGGALDGVKAIIALHIDATMMPGMVGIITESAKVPASNFKIEVKPAVTSREEPFDCIRAVSALLQSLFGSSAESSEKATIISAIETAPPGPQSICQSATLRGSFNSFSKEARREQMKCLDAACATVFQVGGAYDLEYLDSDAGGELDATVTEIMRQVACEVVGEKSVSVVKRKTWTEDYAALLKETPGSMMLLGGQIRTSRRSHHSPSFDVDESALYIGAAILAATAQRLMEEHES